MYYSQAFEGQKVALRLEASLRVMAVRLPIRDALAAKQIIRLRTKSPYD